MLQSLRDNIKGTVATILVVLICIPFVLFGVDSLFAPSTSAKPVVEVDGEPISELDLDRAIQVQRRQLMAQLGDNLSADFFSEESMREPVLQSLIERQAILNAAMEQGMAVGVSEIDKIIVKSQDFLVDGKFDQTRYQQLLRSAGYTNKGYKDLLAKEILLTQFSAGISASSFALPQEVELITKLGLQTRDFQYLSLNVSDVLDQVAASDEQLQTYYQDNIDLYQNPESVTIQAIELNREILTADIEVSEEQIVDQYNVAKANFESSIQRRAAHILFDSSTDDYQVRLQEVQTKLAEGQDFSDLAKQYSDDFGSKDAGGDVGYTTGDSFVEEFEQALVALAVGEVSEPVESEFGIHIIKLLAEEEEEFGTLEEKRLEIVQQLKAIEADSLYISKLEDFKDYTYNVSDLSEAGELLGLETQTIGPFNRANASGVAAKPQILEAAFSGDLIESARSSEVYELDDQTAVVILVEEFSPANAKPFEEVKPLVETAVKADLATELLVGKVEGAIEELNSGKVLEEVASELSIEIKTVEGAKRRHPGVNSELLSHVFSLPEPAGDVNFDSVNLDNGEVALVALTAVHSGDVTTVSEQETAAIDAQLTNMLGQADLFGLRKRLVAVADIER